MMLSGSFRETVRNAREPREKAFSSALVGNVSTDGKTGRRVAGGEMIGSLRPRLVWNPTRLSGAAIKLLCFSRLLEQSLAHAHLQTSRGCSSYWLVRRQQRRVEIVIRDEIAALDSVGFGDSVGVASD